ncbi:glycoside hydrolase family 19 protein [Hyunsoonleella ulvae]|uniref:glycoside hydrolase family 19 protein n=1 Tax=Hyunsoonleella ulvae TaxID=2799948 RepID=UPI00193A83FA|nr:glycoside hydrolase family 19 protein [Hyunsoonleella ulvae]
MKVRVSLLTKIVISILGIVVFLTNCEKNSISVEEEILDTPVKIQGQPISIEIIDYSDEDEILSGLRNTYHLDKHIGLRDSGNIQTKSTKSNSGITVYTDVVKKITKGNYSSYTMLIKSLDDDKSTFYNLTVEEYGDSTGMFVTQYKNFSTKTGKSSLTSKTSSLTGISTKRIDGLQEPVDKEDFGNENGGSSGGTGGGAGSGSTYPTDCDGIVITTQIAVPYQCLCNPHHWPWEHCDCHTQPGYTYEDSYECAPISNIGGTGDTGVSTVGGTGDSENSSGNLPNTSLTTPVNPDGSGLADDCNTKKEDLKKIFPNASDADMKTLAYVLNEKAADFGIDTKEELQHFLAQAAHETGGFKNLGSEENLNYTTKSRLLSIFKKYFSETDTIKKRKPDDYVKNASKLANYVYCCRMGNGKESTGDGYKYRGRGIFQLTGKENYTNFKTWYNAKYEPDNDFVKSPETLKDNDTIAILSALWFYKTKVLDKVTVDSTTTVKKVTLKVNGGDNGIEDRKKHFKKAKDSITCK